MGSTAQLVAGILVGGRSTRMGTPKALLHAPDGVPLAARTAHLVGSLGIPCALVGRRSEVAPLAAALALPVLDDRPPGTGPLGGLGALLAWAPGAEVIALACDHPHLDAAFLARLARAPLPTPHGALAPRRHGRWEPLLARYSVHRARDAVHARAAGPDLSLQPLLDELDALELVVPDEEARALDDWDSPADVARDRAR